jgi:hypothetical protein
MSSEVVRTRIRIRVYGSIDLERGSLWNLEGMALLTLVNDQAFIWVIELTVVSLFSTASTEIKPT